MDKASFPYWSMTTLSSLVHFAERLFGHEALFTIFADCADAFAFHLCHVGEVRIQQTCWAHQNPDEHSLQQLRVRAAVLVSL